MSQKIILLWDQNRKFGKYILHFCSQEHFMYQISRYFVISWIINAWKDTCFQELIYWIIMTKFNKLVYELRTQYFDYSITLIFIFFFTIDWIYLLYYMIRSWEIIFCKWNHHICEVSESSVNSLFIQMLFSNKVEYLRKIQFSSSKRNIEFVIKTPIVLHELSTLIRVWVNICFYFPFGNDFVRREEPLK